MGNPFQDTSSVAMNPIIKFTTLFGLLATEIAVAMQEKHPGLKLGIGMVLFLVALVFIYRSFYGTRIPEENTGTDTTLVLPHHVHGQRVMANKP